MYLWQMSGLLNLFTEFKSLDMMADRMAYGKNRVPKELSTVLVPMKPPTSHVLRQGLRVQIHSRSVPSMRSTNTGAKTCHE